jgi:hypothetical protein
VTATLILKLILTPVLIGTATLAGRRWGDTLSGWLVGVPFTSGPVIFFLALDQGTRFAATASLGVVLGVTSQAAFGLSYVHLGGRRGWAAGIIAGTAAFAAITTIFQVAAIPAVAEPVLVFLSLILTIPFMPRFRRDVVDTPVPGPSNDLPLRILIGTALVVGLTELAPLLGPKLSGLLSPFPLYAAILAVFAQQSSGYPAAAGVWRGLVFGLFGFLGFFTVLAALLDLVGIAPAFVLALLAVILIQAGTLTVLRRVGDL